MQLAPDVNMDQVITSLRLPIEFLTITYTGCLISNMLCLIPKVLG